MGKRIAYMVISCLIILLLSGCGSARTMKIGISMPTKSSERWLLDAKYTVSELQDKGFETEIAFAEDVVGNQASQIESFIESGVDLLIVAPIDSKPLHQVLQKAEDKNIPVISYDRLILDMDSIDFYVSFDNYQVGVLQASYLIEALDFTTGPKTIELFAGSPDDNNSALFFEGAMSVLRPYIESGNLVVPSEQFDIKEIGTLRWDRMIAKSRMTSLLNLYYKDSRLDSVLAPYDGISRGVIEALQENGYDDSDLPVITGQDAESESIKSIVDGKQSMTVFKDVRLLAKEAANMAELILEDKIMMDQYDQLFNGKVEVPSYFLEPISVDADNWKSILVESGYYTSQEIIDDE